MKRILLLLSILLITGCNYEELNDLSVIKSIGIKHETDGYTIIASIVDEIDENNIPKMKVISVKEKSITNCFDELLILSNKTIHYSHIDLLLLDPNLDYGDLNEIFVYFINHEDFRNDFSVISSNNINTLLENSNYDEIEQLLENNHHKKIIRIDIETIIKEYILHNKFKLSLFELINENIEYQKNVTLPLKENYGQ